ncbi:uncharacterized protein LOC120700768 [Panicum virgatum]|uniref:uncharacterized protein LOC120700768 n=1 Tax=Panicum virgatum TaxID=38727 RepID=UPI0019D60695|nr:uncharacterized protein LOC120700768 [Panicum virgatum]
MLEALVSAKDWLTIVQDKDKDKDDEVKLLGWCRAKCATGGISWTGGGLTDGIRYVITITPFASPWNRGSVDMNKPPEMISGNMTAAMCVYSRLFMRYMENKEPEAQQ